MLRTLIIGLLVFLPMAVGHAQDVVRLRSGKFVCGTMTIDDNAGGLRVTLWDTGGSVFIRWSQVPDSEKARLLNRTSTGTTVAVGDILDGVYVVTASREVTGVIVGETDLMLSVKMASSATPAAIPKNAILKREPRRIQEGEAYTPEEMIARRLTPSLSAAKLIELGQFAKVLKLYARAKELFTRAAAADPSKKEEAEQLSAQLDVLIQESAAQTVLSAIRKLEEETRYDKALEAAAAFLSEFSETEVGKQNKDLVKQIEAEKKDFEANRDRILAQRIPEIWRSLRNSLWNKYADRKYKLGEARGAMDRLDEEIAIGVGKKTNCTRDEAEKYWGMREQKPATISMGAGTWIYRGGQDGGMDYSGSGEGGGDAVDDFVKRFGGKKDGGGQSQEQGRKLQTSEEWWTSVSTSERLKWLECYYALSSGLVKKTKEEERDCGSCRGIGTLKATRGGKSVDVICPRCHRVKKDLVVAFW